ncbi:MAG: hypothetical protein ACREDV_12480, partial [Methylocella sp.]
MPYRTGKLKSLREIARSVASSSPRSASSPTARRRHHRWYLDIVRLSRVLRAARRGPSGASARVTRDGLRPPRCACLAVHYRKRRKTRDMAAHAASGFGRAGLEDTLCCS